MPDAAEEQLLETPGYTSDLEAAVAGNDEAKLAEFYKQHFRSIGGSYFADCAVALKGTPSFTVASRLLLVPMCRWG